MENMIETKDVIQSFPIAGGKELVVLKNINIQIPTGKLTMLRGRSGSGKTTLMNLLSALDYPKSGEILFEGKPIQNLPEHDREQIRKTQIGFVFQSVALIPMMTAYENVEFVLRLAGYKGDRRKRTEECLKLVGLGSRMHHMPQELSGGEQQRVAIARAIAHKPKIIFADEPTAELDSNTGLQVMKIFKELIEKQGVTIVMTTHDTGLMEVADCHYLLRMERLPMKINLKEKISKVKQIKSPESAMENPEQTMDVPDDVMIECDSLVKIYKTKDIEVLALQGLDLTVKRGELMAIIGNSGSGKSTFLNMIGGLDRPSAGKLYVDGKNLFQMTENELVKYKRSTVGFVWQNNARNLLPYLTAWENVMTPMLFVEEKEKAVSEEEKKKRALELLELVGLGHRKDSKLSQLSGGEQQRVAIAIALANNPKLLLADEPTGAVDRKTADDILEMFRKLNEKLGLTIVIVTHDKELAKKVNRVVSIRDGKTSSERIMKNDYRERMEHLDIDWQEEETQEEFAVLDRAGRVQIPSELLEQMGMDGNKVKLEFIGGKIVIEKPKD